MIEPQVREYITQARAARMTDESIRQELLKSGWRSEQFQEALMPAHGASHSGQRRALVVILVLMVVVGGGASAAYYFFARSAVPVSPQQNAVLPNPAPMENTPPQNDDLMQAANEKFSAELGNCLKKQDWYSHPVAFKKPGLLDRLMHWVFAGELARAQVSIDFPTFQEELSLPPYENNPCQELAWNSPDPETLRFLSQSVDPVIQITLAFNPHVPYDVQLKIYQGRTSLPATWDDIDETARFNRSATPQQWVVSQFAQNPGINPVVMNDIVAQYRAKGDSFLDTKKVSWMLHDPDNPDTTHLFYGATITPPTTELLDVIDDIVRKNDPENNIDISRVGVLPEKTIRYLAAFRDYEWPQEVRPSQYQFVDTPYATIRENIRLFQDAPKDIVLTFFKDLRTCDYFQCEMSPKNLAKIERELLTPETIKVFTDGSGGIDVQNSINNYATIVLNLAVSPTYYEYQQRNVRPETKTSSEILQLIVKTFSDPQTLKLFAPHDTRDLSQAVDVAQKELDRRAWVPPAQRTLVWDVATWWELADARTDLLGKCDDGEALTAGNKVYTMQLGVGYEWVSKSSPEIAAKVLERVEGDGWALCGESTKPNTSYLGGTISEKNYRKNSQLLTVRTYSATNDLQYSFEYAPTK